jgi:hypothetical protein
VIATACADNGDGVEHMSWSSWTASDATGQGSFWLKLCQPSCAEGKIAYYPVAVTLSGVQSSSEGPWFRDLAITFTGARPPGTVPTSYGLAPPQS